MPRKRFVAIGSDMTRPVVWGMGWSTDLAREEARGFDPSWAARGSCFVEVSEALAERIKLGEVSCESLGIFVKFDAAGFIVSAEVK